MTTVPHVRFGYIRNGIYYIPTNRNADGSGDVRKTPNVVSKIHVTTKFLNNITISEKYAVGAAAVRSDSAEQLFAETASEQMAHSKDGSLSASNIAAPPVNDSQISQKKVGRRVSGNKPLAGESGGSEALERQDIQGHARETLRLLPKEKRTPKLLGRILDKAKAPAEFSRDGNGLAEYIGDPRTSIDQLNVIGIALDSLADSKNP